MTEVTTRPPEERPHAILPEGDSRTRQEFKDEVDINKILERYQRAGIDVFRQNHQATWADVPALDFREALELVRDAEQTFSELPSSLRKKFNNDPAQYMEFVQNPDNIEEMIELGLAERPPKEEGPRQAAPAAVEEAGAAGAQSSSEAAGATQSGPQGGSPAPSDASGS